MALQRPDVDPIDGPPPTDLVVDDTDELTEALRRGEWKEPGAVRAEASPELLATVREFIECR